MEYLRSDKIINKAISVLNFDSNTIDINKLVIHNDKITILEKFNKAFQKLYPNKWDLYTSPQENYLIYLVSVGDLNFYYSGGNKIHPMKGCYVGFTVDVKYMKIGGMCMVRDKFSLKEYYKNLWHQSHASGNTSMGFIRTMCFGSNRYMQTLDLALKGKLEYVDILSHLYYLPEQIQHENPRSPLNGTVSKLNQIVVKGATKYNDNNFYYTDNYLVGKEGLLKNTKFTFKSGKYKWLKFNEALRKFLEENGVNIRTYYYEGEDYVLSSSGNTIPTTHQIDKFQFRDQVIIRVIHDLQDHRDDVEILKKIKASPTRVPDLYIQKTLEEFTNYLNSKLTVYLIRNKKKEDYTQHLVSILSKKKELKA